MTAKILKTLLMLLGILTITACSRCEPEIKYVDRPYRTYVPVKCIVPDANCSFNRDTYTGVISAPFECITNMKRNEEVCK